MKFPSALNKIPYGLYVHIPFCRKKCGYCSFYSIPASQYDSALVNNYVSGITEEIEQRLETLPSVLIDTVYFGGGTPSILGPEQVEKILSSGSLKNVLMPGAEISLEMNPEDITPEKIKALADSGINRFTAGVQTLSADAASFIGRSAGPCGRKTLETFFSSAGKGLSLCVDLIAGIPAQESDSFVHDLEYILSFRPDHVSMYLLSLEKNTPLSVNNESLLKSDSFDSMQAAHFTRGIAALKKCGYRHYEISNFCLNDRVSKHNMKYWTYSPYIGIGAGAHSFIEGRRLCNSMSAAEYANTKKFFYDEDTRKPSAEIAEYIFTGIRLINGFSIERMKNNFNTELPDAFYTAAASLESRGLLESGKTGDEWSIRLTHGGLLLMDPVIYELTECFL